CSSRRRTRSRPHVRPPTASDEKQKRGARGNPGRTSLKSPAVHRPPCPRDPPRHHGRTALPFPCARPLNKPLSRPRSPFSSRGRTSLSFPCARRRNRPRLHPCNPLANRGRPSPRFPRELRTQQPSRPIAAETPPTAER